MGLGGAGGRISGKAEAGRGGGGGEYKVAAGQHKGWLWAMEGVEGDEFKGRGDAG
jgi:hypothetical protein